MTFPLRTTDTARGKWRGILLEFGVPEEALSGKHTACPLCGGKDRFRFDNKEGRGTYYCNQCGAGDGFSLAMKFTGQSFALVAARIDQITGQVSADRKVLNTTNEVDRPKLLRATWRHSRGVQPGDLVHKYLASRGLTQTNFPRTIRFTPKLRDGEGGIRPAMLAAVGRFGEKACTIHKTFLRSDGMSKAEMQSPRKFMAGCPIHDGACVQLSAWIEGGVIGIAEGIETAMAASKLFGIPVWSALNANLLGKWEPPPRPQKVYVFGDNDSSTVGQNAAYQLAKRLKSQGLRVSVEIPEVEGEDWNDVLLKQRFPSLCKA